MEDKTERDILDSLSSHERREQAKKEKEDAHEQKETAHEIKQRKKNYIWIGIVIFILITFAVVVGWLLTNKEETYTDRQVHWHVILDIEICGEKQDIRGGKTSGTMSNQAMYGPHLLHHHNDNTIHIEGQIMKKEDIALGNFFDGIDIPFSKDQIMDKKNGDLCPDGNPGVWKMYVNDRPREDFRDYIPFATGDGRKQVIKLVFGPEEAENQSKA